MSAKSTVITIDGPAGAGKSTVARLLAQRLGFHFLDTGAMYRCVTLAVLRSGMSVTDEEAVRQVASKLTIELDSERVVMNGEDVSQEIRLPKVAAAIGLIADNVAVRCHLTQLQRDWAAGKNVVTEGRDQGTEVFADSPCKIFLVASTEVRARRREVELRDRGIEMTFDEVLQQQNQRDRNDASRPVGALRKAADAVEFCTEALSLEAVVDELEAIVRQRIALPPNSATNQPPSNPPVSSGGQ